MWRNDYIIQFQGLKDGMHKFEYEAGDDFFSRFKESEIKRGNICIHADLDKKPQMLSLSLEVKGTVNITCDRCLDFFDLKIEGASKLFFTFGDKEEEIAHDLVVLQHNTHELDIAHYIYESIILVMPYKKIHPAGRCNPEMIQKISGIEEKSEPGDTMDSRWDELKDIFKNN